MNEETNRWVVVRVTYNCRTDATVTDCVYVTKGATPVYDQRCDETTEYALVMVEMLLDLGQWMADQQLPIASVETLCDEESVEQHFGAVGRRLD